MSFRNFYWYCETALEPLTDFVKENRFFVLVSMFAVSMCAIVFGAIYFHFFLGVDIPKISISNQNTAGYWGQLGDFAGGFLNPLLSFLALMAVLKTMALQRAEMQAAQQEAKIATQEQKQQTAVYSKQMFESTLFGMLEVHAKILNDINYVGPLSGVCVGRRATELIVKEFKSTDSYTGSVLFPDYISEETIQNQIDQFCVRWKGALGHYFRNLYWIMKMIDSSEEMIVEGKYYRASRARKIYTDYVRKRNYTNIVRAQISDSEMALLQINCIGPFGADLKYFVEKYSLIKPLGKNHFGAWAEYMSGKFNDMAFFGLEEIDVDLLAESRSERIKTNTSKIRKNSTASK